MKTSIQGAVCGNEVPLDEAVVPEVVDRLVYLRGLDCYALWRATRVSSPPVANALRPAHSYRSESSTIT